MLSYTPLKGHLIKKRFSYECQALHSSREETLKEDLQYPGILSSFMKSLRGRKHRKTMSKSDFFENKIKSSSKVSTKIRTPERPGLHSPHRLGSPSRGLNETRPTLPEKAPPNPRAPFTPCFQAISNRSASLMRMARYGQYPLVN